MESYRWTATVNFLITESRIETKTFYFDDMYELSEELDEAMENAGISWHSLIGDIKVKYNGQLDSKPVSMAQLFFEGDMDQMGGVH